MLSRRIGYGFVFLRGERTAKRGEPFLGFPPLMALFAKLANAVSPAATVTSLQVASQVAAVIAVGGTIVTPRPVLAACTPFDIGTAGNDIILCDVANPPGGLVDGLAGNDTITLDGVVAPGVTVRGDTGVDTIRLINGAQVTNIEGEGDADTIELIDGTVTNVNWGDGDESVTLDLSNVTVSLIVMGTGNDTVVHDAGTIGSSVYLGSSLAGTSIGADSFTLNGGNVVGRVVGDNGVDTINLNSGSVGSEVRGLGANDVINLAGTATISTIDGGAGVDTINLDSGTVTNVNWGAGDETYTLDLTNVTVTNIAMGLGADNFTHSAGHIGFSLFMGAGVNVGTDADTFTLDGGTIGGRIEGDLGVDTINLNSGSVTLEVRAGGGDDIVNLVGTANIGQIQGGAGVDTINLTSGTVGAADWGPGDETYTLDLTNVTVTHIIMGTGADNFTHGAGNVIGSVFLGTNVFGGTDADTFTLDGGTISGRIEGDSGADTINLNDGTVVQVRSRNGDDIINLVGTADIGSIDAGNGVDTIDLDSGTVGSVNWGAGDESGTLDLTNVTLTGGLVFGTGSDNFTLTDGTVNGSVHLGTNVFGGTDADTFTLDGGTITARIEGDSGADTLNLNGGEVLGGTSVRTRGGDDVITLDGTILHSSIDAGDGSDAINLISGGVTSVNAGAGDDSGVLDLTNVTVGNTATPGISDLVMGSGSDNFTLNAGVINGSVALGTNGFNPTSTDVDTFTLNAGTITGQIEGDHGADTINLNGGDVSGANSVRTRDGNDVINLAGSVLAGSINAGGGDDSFNWTDGTVAGGVTGGNGADTVTISAAGYDGTNSLNGSQTDTATDTLTFNGANANVNANTIRGWELVSSIDSTLDFDSLQLNGVNGFGNDNVTTALNVTGGDVTLSGTSVLADLLGSASDETLTATETTVVSNNIEGAGGADTISVTGNASVTSGVFGGAAGHDASGAADGVDTITINTTGSVGSVDGGLGDDAINLTAGTVNTNVLGGDGDDTITIFDSFTVTNTIDGGANTAAGDTIVADTAATRTFDASNLTDFEILQKDNTGLLTLTGAHSFTGGAVINGGTLDVDGTTETPTVAMADGATLNVDGTVQAAGPTQAAITGSAGVNTVNVAGTLRAAGDLGGGADVLDVAGTLDTGGGTFALGLGDDTFTIHDGTTVIGTVDGGAGADVFNTNIATTASVGATLGFETLLKTGAGILNLTGPAASAFDTINVNDGMVDTDGAINGVSAASVLAGATFNVDGPLSFTAGANTLTVAGVISGASAIDLGAGDDTFTFQEGAVTSVPVDGGTGTDTLNANILTAGSLARAANFETLTKTGAGVLNVTGPGVSDFSTVNVNQGTLDVAAVGSITDVRAATVAAGATLDADGAFSFTAGTDTFDVAGVVTGSGTFDMLGGDDTLTLRDGANLSSLTSVIDGGGAATNDRLVLDNALALSFSSDQIAGFEQLTKQNAGVASLAGAHSYSAGIAVNGGTLDVDGTTETPTVTLVDGTILNVDGTVQAAGSTQVAITGSAGVNAVSVNAGATLFATGDLGDGTDVLDVAGTLDTGAGTFFLGAGDDTFVVYDTTVVMGALDAGLGNDTLNVNVSAPNLVPLGATTGFESLAKSGLGGLQINGPSSFVDVSVQAGLLEVTAPTGSVAARNTTIAAGASLQLDGAYTGTTGGDTFDVAGAVLGGSGIDLLGGDDVLTLRDGADISALTSPIDGNAGIDTVIIDSATAQSLDSSQVMNFETLQKDNTGMLTVTGAQSFSGGTTLNGGTLDVDGIYETPTVAMRDATTFNVDDTAQAAGATQAVVVGSAGVNTVNVAGTLLASADLGDGIDVLDVTGTLDSGTGVFALGFGDDTFTVNDGATVLGTVDGGAGTDTINTDIATSATLGAGIGFEILTKTGAGVLSVVGPAASSFDTVNINAGNLDITAAGAVVNVNVASIAEGATLNTDGVLLFTPGPDQFDVAGTLSGSGDIDMLNDDDVLIVRAGADISGFTTTIDGGDGVDRVEFYNLVGVLPDAFTNFEEIYLLDATTADAHLPGGGIRTLDAMLFVSADSRFIADGNSPGITSIAGNFVNLGVVAMADGAADDRINVGGDYAGGGILEIDAALDETAAADLLVIEGNIGAVTTTLAGTVTSNPTLLSVTDVGTGRGVETGTGPGAGIAVVDVSATGATAEGDFVLENPLVAGEYTYDLNLETDGIWYLQSELLEQVAGYSSALPGMVGIMNRTIALGSDSRAARAGRADYFHREANTGHCKPTETWARARGGRLREKPEIGPRLRQSYRQLDLGFGRGLQTSDSECFSFAARGIVGLADSDAYHIDREAAGADLDTRYYGGGFSATLLRNDGFYLDLSSQALRFDTDISVHGEGVKAGIDAWGVSASVESGLRAALSNDLYITPRIQLNWNGLYGDDFVDEDGAEIAFGDNHQFSITHGVIVERTSHAEWAGDEARLAVYGVFDLQFNVNRDLSIISSGEEFEYVGNRVWTRVGAGATLALNENASFYGELSGTGALSGSLHDSHGFEGNLGFRVRW